MKRIAFAVLLSLLAAGAGAEPMKCVDASGKIRYLDSTLIGTEKCQPVKEGTNVVAPQAAPRAAPPPPQASRGRGEQAQAKLAAEEKLAEARKKLKEQEAVRSGDERNYARVLERLQPYREAVEQAQREVEQLERGSR